MPETKIAARDGSGEFAAYVAKPKSTPAGGPAGAVVMIQEIFGINGAMRALSDWVAEMGFVAVAPDLFWRQQPKVDLDPDKGQGEWDKAFALMNGMDQDKAVEDLQAAVTAARGMEGANGKVATMGFCLGGRLAYMMAARSDADCNVSYYGVGLDGLLGEAGNIRNPLLLHIAGKDKFVPPEAQKKVVEGLRGNSKVEAHVYPWADHAFSRRGGHSYDARAATIADGRSAELLTRVLG
jgi:carboxymethylenebutenolidase